MIWQIPQGTASYIQIATGPVNPPGIHILAGGEVQFNSLPGQKPDLQCRGGVVTQTEHKPAVV
jgi:hypothetical protein